MLKKQFCYSLGAIALITLVAVIVQSCREPNASRPSWFIAAAYVPKPHVIVSPAPPAALVKPLFGHGTPEASALRLLVSHPPHIHLNGWVVCHVLHAYSVLHFRYEGMSSRDSAIQILTHDVESKSRLGSSVLMKTRYGARFTLGPGTTGETHRDLCLASLSDVGTPLSAAIQPAGADHPQTIQDILNDSISTFDISARELQWTAVAYARYSPLGWTNRNGKTFTLNDIATRLLNTPIQASSCAGTHVLMALTVIYLQDTEYHVLDAKVRSQLEKCIRHHVDLAAASQLDDGGWTVGWCTNRSRSAYVMTPLLRLLATGHILEWLENLPPDLQPGERLYRRAAGWLVKCLPQYTSSNFPDTGFCPWIHGMIALANLVEPDKDASVEGI